MAFGETSSYWSALKAPNFLVFHWSPHDSPVSTGQHIVTTRVVHFPKRLKQAQSLSLTEGDLITHSNESVWAVHSCSSWLVYF